jgi:uncharacterized protein (TIGR02687 family)
MDRIRHLIENLLKDQRIIFWYDAEGEFKLEIWTLDIPDVEVIYVDNNEFGVKYRILVEEPKKKFLLYFDHAKPDIKEDWLADVRLANAELHIDKASFVLSDLELGRENSELIREYEFFFKSTNRVDKLKGLLTKGDSQNKIRLKMTAVCCNCEPHRDEVLMSLFAEQASETRQSIELLKKCALDKWIWQQLKALFGYDNHEPTIKDFIIVLFNYAYRETFNEQKILDSEAILLLKRFKDNIRYKKAFRLLSGRCSDWLSMERNLIKRDIRELMNTDYFELIEKKILSELKQSILSGRSSEAEIEKVIHQRMQSHWFEDYQHEYNALNNAVHLLNLIRITNLRLHSFEEALANYQSSWFYFDFYYRKFIFHYQKAVHTDLLSKLYEEIENRYQNDYMFPLATAFSEQLKGLTRYESSQYSMQMNFWQKQVNPYLDAGKKICVIISDALRYEIGAELMSMIRQEDRFEAELHCCLAMLPSYTQIGMAALLPHQNIRLGDEGKGKVYIDGQNSSSEFRQKILSTHAKALALKADYVLNMSSMESKQIFRNHQVIYVYHNLIDAIGDDTTTETKVCEAIETGIEELILIVRKLTSGNATNIIITTDHGFLYQHKSLSECDFMSESSIHGEILYKQRRFIIGKNLHTESNMMHFTSQQLGLDGELDVLIPMANQRMRLQGSGSRFVHGGASLQEIMLPILKINKKRVSDVEWVEVDIISNGERIISTGQLVIRLYQREPVNDKKQPLTLKIGIYTEAGKLISEEKTVPFDFTSENPRDREFQCSLLLSKSADDANEQNVIVKLEKLISGTSRYQEYKRSEYTLRRAFMSDFDL